MAIVKPGPGDPAAHRLACLPLLPSGPGGVYKIPLHRAQPLSVVSDDPQTENRRVSTHRRTDSHDMAERVGFEPTVPLPAHVLSRHADSATLAPLRMQGLG